MRAAPARRAASSRRSPSRCSARLSGTQTIRAGGVKARAELDVLVAPGPVERLAPAADVERLETPVADVAAVEAVIRVRVAADPASLVQAPVGDVPGAVGTGRADVGKPLEPGVHVRCRAKEPWQPDEAPQAERGHATAGVAVRMGPYEPGRRDDVVVERHGHVPLGDAQAAVARARRRESAPVEGHPLRAEAPGERSQRPVGRLRGRASDEDHLQPLARVGLCRKPPQSGREVAAEAPVWDDDADRRLVPRRGPARSVVR